MHDIMNNYVADSNCLTTKKDYISPGGVAVILLSQ